METLARYAATGWMPGMMMPIPPGIPIHPAPEPFQEEMKTEGTPDENTERIDNKLDEATEETALQHTASNNSPVHLDSMASNTSLGEIGNVAEATPLCSVEHGLETGVTDQVALGPEVAGVIATTERVHSHEAEPLPQPECSTPAVEKDSIVLSVYNAVMDKVEPANEMALDAAELPDDTERTIDENQVLRDQDLSEPMTRETVQTPVEYCEKSDVANEASDSNTGQQDNHWASSADLTTVQSMEPQTVVDTAELGMKPGELNEAVIPSELPARDNSIKWYEDQTINMNVVDNVVEERSCDRIDFKEVVEENLGTNLQADVISTSEIVTLDPAATAEDDKDIRKIVDTNENSVTTEAKTTTAQAPESNEDLIQDGSRASENVTQMEIDA
jgi:hypothetical protein